MCLKRYAIPIPTEHRQCQQNVSRMPVERLSRVTLRLSIYQFFVYQNFTIMVSVATKRRAENKSYKIKYKALKELEKRSPHKDVASLFGVPKKYLIDMENEQRQNP